MDALAVRNTSWLWRLVAAIAVAGCASPPRPSPPIAVDVPAAPSSSAVAPGLPLAPMRSDAWTEFWQAHGVEPAPPVEVFDISRELGFRVDNLTNGGLSDAEAEEVAMAAVRRAAGDRWAALHFRYDIVDSEVLGPAGLNGT